MCPYKIEKSTYFILMPNNYKKAIISLMGVFKTWLGNSYKIPQLGD